MLNVKYNRLQGSFYPFTFLLFYFYNFFQLLLSFLVLAENLDFLHQWCDGINTLAVSGKVVEGEVYIEEIFPLMSDDGQRLNLGQVHIVEAQDGEHLGERSLVVGQRLKTMLALLAFSMGRRRAAFCGLLTTRKRV